MKAAVARALERCGSQMEGYAKDLAPVAQNAGGTLRGSISHQVSDNTVYVGSNTEYAAYVEYGTGRYSDHPGGGTTKDKWVYQDKFGEWHTGYPQQPRHFLKPAVADHTGTYENIIKDELKG